MVWSPSVELMFPITRPIYDILLGCLHSFDLYDFDSDSVTSKNQLRVASSNIQGMMEKAKVKKTYTGISHWVQFCRDHTKYSGTHLLYPATFFCSSETPIHLVFLTMPPAQTLFGLVTQSSFPTWGRKIAWRAQRTSATPFIRSPR